LRDIQKYNSSIELFQVGIICDLAALIFTARADSVLNIVMIECGRSHCHFLSRWLLFKWRKIFIIFFIV